MNRNFFIVFGIGIFLTGTLLIFAFNFTSDETPDEKFAESLSINSEIKIEKFCGTSDEKSTHYVKEYKIPTECSQPQAITFDDKGNVWFAQSNTASIGKFDPLKEEFTYYENPLWEGSDPTMIYGIDYAPDNSLWFTDDLYNSVWKFKIDKQQFYRFSFPSDGQSMPQKLKIMGSKMIVNDFTGNKIAIFDLTSPDQNLNPFLLPSNNPRAVTSAVTLDNQNNLWYPSWELNATGVIIKINQTSLDAAMQNLDFGSTEIDIEFFALPNRLSINGIEFDNEQNLWLADSMSSNFFKFKPISGNKNFTKFVTSEPASDSFGNFSGGVTSPISRPTWIKHDALGNLVFIESDANRIAIMNPKTETLIEYEIPSKNPHWADCGGEPNCGRAQIFDFEIDGNKIWFTEWAENKIGFVDTSIEIPIHIEITPQELKLNQGEIKNFEITLKSNSKNSLKVQPLVSNPNLESGIDVQLNFDKSSTFVDSENPIKFNATVYAGNKTSDEYKILIGSLLQDVTISNFLSVIVE